MASKLAATAAVVIAILAILGSYTQMSALRLEQQSQPFYWPHRRTYISGVRYRNRWQPTPNRSDYDSFRGGGIGSGK